MQGPDDWVKYDEAFGSREWRIRNLYKIPDTISKKGRKASGLIMPFDPNRVQLDIAKKSANHQRVIVLKARQHGVTTGFAVEHFDTVLWNPNTWCAILAPDKDTLKIVFNKIQIMWDNLHPELKSMIEPPKNDNEFEIFWRGMNSRIYVALRVIGGTNQILHITEAAKVEDWRIAETRPAVTPDTLIIEESTPMAYGDRFHKKWQTAKTGESDYLPLFYEWWWRDDYRKPVRNVTTDNLQPDEAALVDNFGLDLEQIQWRRDMYLDQQQSDGSNLFSREYPEDDVSCFVSAGTTAFDTKTLAIKKSFLVNNPPPFLLGHLIKRNEQPFFEEDRNGPLKLHELPKRGYQYVLGVDISMGGDDADWQCGQVLKRGDIRKQVAEFRIRTEIGAFAKAMALLGKFYFTAYTCPERNNNPGEAFIREFLELYPHDRIYRQRDDLKTRKDYPSKYGYWTKRGKYGKMMIVSLLQDALAEDSIDIFSADLIDQMMSFQKKELVSGETGFSGHKKPDDDIMAMCLALEMDRILPALPEPAEEMRRMMRRVFKKQKAGQELPSWEAA